MIAMYRLSDNEVMPDKQRPDVTKIRQRAAQVQQELDNLPGNTSPEVVAQKQELLNKLLAQIEAYEQNRKNGCAQMYGLTPGDYGIIQVPEAEEADFWNSLYVEYDGDTMTYHTNPRYEINGSVITVNPGWVKQQHRLIDADVTDWSGETLTEPLFFRLVFAQVDATQAITVQLLTRLEEEEFADLPAGLTLISMIVEGRINVDNSITEGVF
jgi:hypothetical protein